MLISVRWGPSTIHSQLELDHGAEGLSLVIFYCSCLTFTIETHEIRKEGNTTPIYRKTFVEMPAPLTLRTTRRSTHSRTDPSELKTVKIRWVKNEERSLSP